MRRILTIVAMLAAATTLHAEAKNLQVLNGLSDFELQRTMQMMAASLGVRCDFCHAESATEKGHLDFASDAKKEKETARDMIQMTEKINKEQFAGRTEVSCYTCHHGSSHPASMVALPTLVPVRPAASAPKPALPSLEDIVKHYTAALGDVAKLQSPRVLKGTREGSDGKPYPMELQESNGRLHVIVTLPESSVEQWWNNETGASRDARGVHKLSEANVEAFRQNAGAYAPVLPSAIPANARVVTKDKVGDRDAYVVVSRGEDGTRERFYFDAATGLLLRHMVIRDSPVGSIPQQTDYDDYRDVAGAKFPFMVKVSLVDPFTGSTRRYTDVQLGAKIEDSVFTPPS